MADEQEKGWIEKVTQLTEQVKHLQQENERLRQTLGLHAIEERKLRDRLNDNRRF